MDSTDWIFVTETDELEEDDILRFDHKDLSLAIYRTSSGFYATDGFCTHEKVHLEEGLVIGHSVECAKHQGRFNIKTGEAKASPACINLKTYETSVKDDKLYVKIPHGSDNG